MATIALNETFPSTATTTLEQRYIAIPQGTWRLASAYFCPATTAAAGDGTNAAHVTLATSIDSGANFVVQDTLTGNGSAYTVGVPRAFDCAATPWLEGGDSIRIAKTVDGTGGTIDGSVTILLEKVN
jgi:hypothetical protein